MKAEGAGGTVARRKTDLILQQAAQERIDSHQEVTTEDVRTLVRFFLGEEQYAIDAVYISGVWDQEQWSRIYPIPCVPRYLLGVINLRSSIISILDLCDYFGLPTSEIDEFTRIMVVDFPNEDYDGDYEGGQLEVGFLVDKVEDIIKVSQDEIQPALTTIEKVTAEYIEGETHYLDETTGEETLIGIIDVESVLVAEMNSRLGETGGTS